MPNIVPLWATPPKDLVGDVFYQGIVLYMGDKVLSLGEKLYAIPVSALWEKI